MNGISLNQILRGFTYSSSLPYSITPLIKEISANKAQSVSRNFISLLNCGSAQISQINSGYSFPQTQNIQGEQAFATQVHNELQQSIYTPSLDDQQKLNDVNAKLMKNGKAPLHFQNVTREIENIMNDSSLNEKQKKDLVGKVRERLGLSKGDMKALFTKRLGNLHEQAANKLKTRVDALEQNAKEIEKIYGKDSPQAIQAFQALENSKSILEGQRQQYKQKASSYNKMFPSGFWSKVGGFFKGVVSGITKVVNMIAPILKMIPGIGTLASIGTAAINALNSIVHGDWKGLLHNVANNLVTAIPGLGSVAQVGMNAFHSIKSFAQGNILGGISGLMSFTGALPEKIGSVLDKTWNAFGTVYSAAKGNFTPLLNNALGFASTLPIVQRVQESWNNFTQRINTNLNQGLRWIQNRFPL